MKLVLQPCGDGDARKHFIDTVQNPVSIERILPYIPERERDQFAAAFGDAVAVWGVTPGVDGRNSGLWGKLEQGDPAWFYANKRFFARGVVAYKLHSQGLARDLWQEKSDGGGETWEYVYFLTDIDDLDVSISDFNSAAGYHPNFFVRGFLVLDEKKSHATLSNLKISPPVSPARALAEERVQALRELRKLEGDLTVTGEAKRRREQPLLRTLVLGRSSHADCAICHRRLPIDLLVIGHIRRRHTCDTDQLLDVNNVMPVCLLGCDTLFEKGYLYVDSTGRVKLSSDALRLEPVVQQMQESIDTTCTAWTNDSEPYFSWHRLDHLKAL